MNTVINKTVEEFATLRHHLQNSILPGITARDVVKKITRGILSVLDRHLLTYDNIMKAIKVEAQKLNEPSIIPPGANFEQLKVGLEAFIAKGVSIGLEPGALATAEGKIAAATQMVYLIDGLITEMKTDSSLTLPALTESEVFAAPNVDGTAIRAIDPLIVDDPKPESAPVPVESSKVEPVA